MTLDSLPIGKPAIILTVGGEGDLRCHLLDMGLIPHTEVTVRKVAPLGERVFLGTYDFRNATAGDPDVFEMAIGSGKAGTSFTVDYIRSYAVKEDA